MRENNPHHPRYRQIEQSEEWPDLVEYWEERGYKYDYSVGCFTIFDSFKGVTDWMTATTALNKAIEEMDNDA